VTSYVYFAGWNNIGTNFPFVVARGNVKLGADDPTVQMDVTKDVLNIPMPYPCYDLFDEVTRPHMSFGSNGSDLILIIPGRCALFVKIVLPTDPTVKFNTVVPVPPLDPTFGDHRKYLSSGVFDAQFNTIYYIMKTYNTPGADLFSFDSVKWLPNVKEINNLDDLAESETVIVLGYERNNAQLQKWIFVIASGANKIKRVIVQNDLILSVSTAVLTPSINRISAAYYWRPFLYFTTHEPDAKIVRITKSNFCDVFCGDNGFCDTGVCKCQPGYTIDPTSPQSPCKPINEVKTEIQERQSEGAAAALGVLFAFALLAAIAGWFLWWKGRNQGYTSVK